MYYRLETVYAEIPKDFRDFQRNSVLPKELGEYLKNFKHFLKKKHVNSHSILYLEWIFEPTPKKITIFLTSFNSAHS